MADDSQTKSIRVHILGREYALRVQEEDEAFTREVASFVNARMEQFRDNHPEQAELTTGRDPSEQQKFLQRLNGGRATFPPADRGICPRVCHRTPFVSGCPDHSHD